MSRPAPAARRSRLPGALRAFIDDECPLRAAALANSTLLATVPLLAVVLALLRASGFEESLRPFLLERFPVLGVEGVDQVLDYIGRANARAVGGVGVAALLVSVWSLLSGVEGALQRVFGPPAARNRLRRAADYLAVVVVGSVVLILTVALQALLRRPELLVRALGEQAAGEVTRLVLGLVPWGTAFCGFAFLYLWMAGRRVPTSSAWLGALCGGTLFQLGEIAYLKLQFGFAGYHAIYGALAQLPILLVWLWGSWCAALLGAEIAAAHSSRARAADAEPAPAQAALALAALERIADAFACGRPAPRTEELAAALRARPLELRSALGPLVEAGILVDADSRGYLLANAPAAIPLERVLAALR